MQISQSVPHFESIIFIKSYIVINQIDKEKNHIIYTINNTRTNINT